MNTHTCFDILFTKTRAGLYNYQSSILCQRFSLLASFSYSQRQTSSFGGLKEKHRHRFSPYFSERKFVGIVLALIKILLVVCHQSAKILGGCLKRK